VIFTAPKVAPMSSTEQRKTAIGLFGGPASSTIKSAFDSLGNRMTRDFQDGQRLYSLI
jgi:hypothetical protein